MLAALCCPVHHKGSLMKLFLVGICSLFHGGIQNCCEGLPKVVRLQTSFSPSMFRRGWWLCSALSIRWNYLCWVGLCSSRAGSRFLQWVQCISLQCFAQNVADACIKFNARLKCLNVVLSLEAVCLFFVQVRLLAGLGAILYVIKMQS